MRITGGQAKGRILASLRGRGIRPTSDRVKEAVFDIIGKDLSGQMVLDLFAGTGGLGLEALSRGALRAVFIDNSRKSVALIRKNLGLCGYLDSGSVLRRDLTKPSFKGYALFGKEFDLVFLDPPYGKNFLPSLLERLSTSNTLSSRSHVVAESWKTERLPASFGNLEMVDTRIYGDTRINIYAYEVDQ